jgi:hypothetical protein
MARGFVWWAAWPLVNGVPPKREQAQVSSTSISSGLDLRCTSITRRRWPSFDCLRIASSSCGGESAFYRSAFRSAGVRNIGAYATSPFGGGGTQPLLHAQFRDPLNPNFPNSFGLIVPTSPLEGGTAGGDSGGPIFIQTAAGLVQIGELQGDSISSGRRASTVTSAFGRG